MPPVIELRELTVRFAARTAVDRLTLDVHAGEVLALLGHNGAGKTTTVRTANGLVEPASGSVTVFGHSPSGRPELLRRVAIVTETSSLDERLTAHETLAVFAELFEVPAAEVPGRTERLLGELGLADRAGDRVATFSKGMRQRLALARALLHDPEILYLDEPTGGLDPAATRMVQGLIKRWREEGRTVVLCTHNLPEAQELASRVALLGRGRLLALGAPAELSRRLAPSRAVDFEVDPVQSTRAAQLLGERLTVTAGEPGHLVVTGAGREDVPSLVTRLTEAGLRVYRVAPREPSLADAYFALQDPDARAEDAVALADVAPCA